MSRPKTVIKKMAVDRAKRAHYCKHSKKHPIFSGEKRLVIQEGRSKKHYCKICALKFLNDGLNDLEKLKKEIETER